MRTITVVIALLLGLAGPALADARILTVEENAEAPAAMPAPAEAMPPSAPQPERAPAQPEPSRAETPAPAAAGESAAPTPSMRFSFERSRDGFLRLDRETGQVAYCASRAAGWACEVVPEERAALEKEIARLQNTVADLKREIAALREPPPPPRPPAELAPPPPAPKEGGKSGDLTIKLPTQEDINRATAALQRAWDRLVNMIGNLKNDLARKSQPDRTAL